MQWLDADSDTRTYSYEDVEIPYLSNARTGKMRTYWPDFLVEKLDGSKVLVEIKPKRKLDQARVKKKLKAAEAWCQAHKVSLVVMTEDGLRQLGLLK